MAALIVTRGELVAAGTSRLRVERGELHVAAPVGSLRVTRGELTTPTTLTANAGPDQVVEASEIVTLDGSQSTTTGGPVDSFTWTQTAGPTVTLLDAGTAHPSFLAPATVGGTTVSFSLVAHQGASSSAPDAVSVTVYPQIEWFLNDLGQWEPLREELVTAVFVDNNGDGIADL